MKKNIGILIIVASFLLIIKSFNTLAVCVDSPSYNICCNPEISPIQYYGHEQYCGFLWKGNVVFNDDVAFCFKDLLFSGDVGLLNNHPITIVSISRFFCNSSNYGMINNTAYYCFNNNGNGLNITINTTSQVWFETYPNNATIYWNVTTIRNNYYFDDISSMFNYYHLDSYPKPECYYIRNVTWQPNQTYIIRIRYRTNGTEQKWNTLFGSIVAQRLDFELDPLFSNTHYEIGTNRSSSYVWTLNSSINSDIANFSVLMNSSSISVNSSTDPYLVISTNQSVNVANFAINGCVLTQLGNMYRYVLKCDGNGYELKKAAMYKTLFYGTDGTDPRGNTTYLGNVSSIKTSVYNDVGKRGVYFSGQVTTGCGGESKTVNVNFLNVTDNPNVQFWTWTQAVAILYTGQQSCSVVLSDPGSFTQNSACVSNNNPTVTSDETSSDTSDGVVNNPTNLYLGATGIAACTDTNRQRYMKGFFITKQAVNFTWAGDTGFAYNLIIRDYLQNYSLPSFGFVNDENSAFLQSNVINLSLFVRFFTINASYSGNASLNISLNGSTNGALFISNLSNSSNLSVSTDVSVNNKLLFVLYLNDKNTVINNFQIDFLNTNNTPPNASMFNVSATSVTTNDAVTFSANVTSAANNILSDACTFELYKSDLGSPSFNITTNSKSGDIVSKSLTMASIGAGTLEWRKAWCYDNFYNRVSNTSIGINITITQGASNGGNNSGGGNSGGNSGGNDVTIIIGGSNITRPIVDGWFLTSLFKPDSTDTYVNVKDLGKITITSCNVPDFSCIVNNDGTITLSRTFIGNDFLYKSYNSTGLLVSGGNSIRFPVRLNVINYSWPLLGMPFWIILGVLFLIFGYILFKEG